MSNPLQFGYRLTVGDLPPVRLWSPSAAERDQAIIQHAQQARADSDNTRVTIHRLLRTGDGCDYVQDGAPALDVQWRSTGLRTEHSDQLCYQQQHALVELVSGQVTVLDKKNPFSVAQYAEWSKRACLEELAPAPYGCGVKSCWVDVRRATPDEQRAGVHYVVLDQELLAKIRVSSVGFTKPL